jgi:tripartite-type tricarboxylate transporter receptor subunit TctC
VRNESGKRKDLKTLKKITLCAKMVGVAALVPAMSAFAEFPDRPLKLIVPWGAGGGICATGRMIAGLRKDELDQTVNVVNRTGGSGVVAIQQSRQQTLMAIQLVS